jgi:hypothetical protein
VGLPRLGGAPEGAGQLRVVDGCVVERDGRHVPTQGRRERHRSPSGERPTDRRAGVRRVDPVEVRGVVDEAPSLVRSDLLGRAARCRDPPHREIRIVEDVPAANHVGADAAGEGDRLTHGSLAGATEARVPASAAVFRIDQQVRATLTTTSSHGAAGARGARSAGEPASGSRGPGVAFPRARVSGGSGAARAERRRTADARRAARAQHRRAAHARRATFRWTLAAEIRIPGVVADLCADGTADARARDLLARDAARRTLRAALASGLCLGAPRAAMVPDRALAGLARGAAAGCQGQDASPERHLACAARLVRNAAGHPARAKDLVGHSANVDPCGGPCRGGAVTSGGARRGRTDRRSAPPRSRRSAADVPGRAGPSDDRTRAFTLLVRAYEGARRAAAYLQWAGAAR